jgi:hypothetical protein
LQGLKSLQGYNPDMQYWLATNPWYGMFLWMILYTSDYYLTLYCARGFRETGHFQFDGSFELTPQYQKDIDHLQPISRLHMILLLAYSLLILVVWWITRLSICLEWTYPLYLGMFLLLEVAVHLRRLRNVALIREVKKHGGAIMCYGTGFKPNRLAKRVKATEPAAVLGGETISEMKPQT